MSNVMDSVKFSYISDVDIPVLEQHIINHWQKRAKKLNSRKQISLSKRMFLDERLDTLSS